MLLREQNGTATTLQVTGADAQRIVGADGAIWLRLAKTGNTYKAYYSSDGSVWRFMGSTTLNVERRGAGVLAFNRAGTATDLDVAFDYFRVQSRGEPVARLQTDVPGTVGGTVPPVLALLLGPSAGFGTFTPGVSREYTASTTATVTSTAGVATLAVSDPSSVHTGRLVNGAYSLAQPLRVQAASAAGAGGPFAPVGSSTSPTALLSYGGPVSNDAVTVRFAQAIAETEGLRTGAYGKTVTFTLATTQP